MPEVIEFTFDGALSDQHLMDFYEAGRFQYGAARLMVKLDQFRRTGAFSNRVTSDNNTRIVVAIPRPGSYEFLTFAPLAAQMVEAFVQAPISLMWSYVADRIFKPATNEEVRDALQTQRELIEAFRRDIEDRGEQQARTLALLEDRIARGDQLSAENAELRERLLAETERRAYLDGEREILRRISADQDAKLVSMAAPLLKDMGVALRNSANTMRISGGEGENRRRLVFANQKRTREIETSLVDDETTLILVHIVQYNTETGWGKLRTAEHVGLLSFNVPSDLKRDLQTQLLAAMDERQTFIECYFVRSARGILQRAIVVAIRDLDELEGHFA